jgi:hypothetical protein
VNYHWILGILGMTTSIFAAHIAQSNLPCHFFCLKEHLIEDYEPNMLASPSISLSAKSVLTVLGSTSSIEPESITFEEKSHLVNPASSTAKK